MTRFSPGLAARSAGHRNASCRFSGEDLRPRRDALLSCFSTRKQAPGAPGSSELRRDARYRTAVGPKLGREGFARSSSRPAGTRNRHCATRLSKTDTRTCGRLTWPEPRRASRFTTLGPLRLAFRESRSALSSEAEPEIHSPLMSPLPCPALPSPLSKRAGARDAKTANRYPDSA